MSNAMLLNGDPATPFPALHDYLGRLASKPFPGTRLWADAGGRAFGRFFHATLTSAFQPIRTVGSNTVLGYEGFARSHSDSDNGLCLWRLLDHAASDDESVELDRLCRMLHAINFFRQLENGEEDLYLSVHARLLAAVESDHGSAFRRVLDRLGLPVARIVLQLPVVEARQRALLDYVAANYLRNGFRIAVNALDIAEATGLAGQLRPEAVKVDSRLAIDDGAIERLLDRCAARGVRVIFKRVESQSTRARLEAAARGAGVPLHAQGFLWDLPKSALAAGVAGGSRLAPGGRGQGAASRLPTALHAKS